MMRIRIEMPDRFDFSTEMPVRFGDLNAGNHLAHDKVLQIAQEARLMFIKCLGFTGLTVGGKGYVVADAAVVYKSQAFYGQMLKIEIAVGNFTRKACDFIHLIADKTTGQEISLVKIGMVFFDIETQQSTDVPAEFRVLFPDACFKRNLEISD